MKDIIQLQSMTKVDLQSMFDMAIAQALKGVLELKNEKEVYSIKQACEYLDVSRSTLNRWRNDGFIKPSFIGEKPYYSKKGLDALVSGEGLKNPLIIKI